MLQIIKRTAVAAIAAAAIVIPSAAYARIGYIPHAPTLSRPASTTTIRQSTGGQRATRGVDWADAGIGAAVTVVLIGAGTAMLLGRRREVTGRRRARPPRSHELTGHGS
jgi:hypothetical protein